MSIQIILLLGCIVILVFMVIGFVIAFMQGREINFDKRLGDFRQNEEGGAFDDLHERMAGDASTDAPPPDDVKKKKKRSNR